MPFERNSKDKNEQRPKRSRRLGGKGLQRIVVLAGIFGVLTFGVLFLKLWQLQVVQHETLEAKAIAQQTREVSSSAHRGTIYDANGAILAISGSVQNVILSPRDIYAAAEVDTKDEFGNPRSEAVIEAEKKAYVQSTCNLIADNLSAILGVDREEILKKLDKTESAYQVIAKKVEDDVADQVRVFIDENNLEACIYMTDDAKRYYPYSTTASQVVGFVNSQNQGAYGLEALYENELSGEDGRTIIAKNAAGTEMGSAYSTFNDALDGYNIHTTIDANIQMLAEKTVEEGIQKFDVVNGAFCIVMDPKTCAVLAMVSSPDYDLNDYNTINDATLLAQLEKIKRTGTEEEYAKALSEAQFKQWSSKCLNTEYEPGSTFKPVVVAAGLEEGVIQESDTFGCVGYVDMDGWRIRCSARSGHGTQDLRKAVMNSCNPALIDIGQRLGAEKFYQYWENFGFTEPTGIELPGEVGSVFWPKAEFVSPAGIVSLATASFGQRFTVTPIQLITALSACINGGHLMEPYLVQSVTDTEGNVVSYHEPTEVRQVVSQETSDLVRSFMESVVSGRNGTGKNAYVPGYRIGGKTGSSQTLTRDPDTGRERIIVSFVGFAPADDPEVIILLGYDWPWSATPESNSTASGVYISGGNMACPMAGELIANILDYLGHQKSSTTESSGVTIPRLVGMTHQEANAALAKLGLTCRTSGQGEFVTDQAPSPGSSVPKGSSIVLYLGTERAAETVPMPDLSGMTYQEAKEKLESVGLYLNATGTGETGMVFAQEVEPNTPVEVGTAVEVKFVDEVADDKDAIED